MDINRIIELDRDVLSFFNDGHTMFLDGVAFVFTSGLTWIPLYLALFYLVVKNNETMAQIGLVVGCAVLCIFFADGISEYIVKPWIERPRPSNDPVFKYTVNIVNNVRGMDFSFFSAHASNTMSIAVFFSLLVRSRLMTFFMIAWSLLNCWTRMYLGLHYPGDIMVGLVWGTTVGSLVYLLYYHLYLKIGAKLNYVSTQYTSTGYALSDVDMVITVLMLTCCVAVMCGLTVIQ